MTNSTLIVPAPQDFVVEYPKVVLPVVTVGRSLVIRLLDKAVRGKGADHVQRACYYGEKTDEFGVEVQGTDSPGCIVGYVLWLLLGPVAFKQAIDQAVIDNGAVFNTVWDNVPGYEFTPAAKRLLLMAQMLQDGRGGFGGGEHVPWGQAVRLAQTLSCLPGLDDLGDSDY